MADYTTGVQTTEHIGTYLIKAQNTVDCSKTTAGTTGVHAVLDIPAGAYVLSVMTVVTTAEGATCTFDVGDGSDPNGWDDAVDGNAAAAYISAPGTDAYATAGGKYYSAADTIDIDMDNEADAMIAKIVAIYCMVE